MDNPDQSSEKDRFSLALDNRIKAEVDAKMKEEDAASNQLVSPEHHRAQLEKEIREELKGTEVEKEVAEGIKILVNEGESYLGKEAYTLLMEDLDRLLLQLDTIDLTDEDLKQALSISQKSETSILKVAIEKFNQHLLLDSLSIFTLLSILKEDEPDYIYRTGLVAQECEQYERALEAYHAATLLDPLLIGAHIFSAQCFLQIGQPDHAVEELEKAKEILKTAEIQDFWRKHVTDIEVLLAAVP